MGEIAEMMLEGILCEQCGVYLDSDSYGCPRLCASCSKREGQHQGIKLPCPRCGKKVKEVGLKQHLKDKHGVTKPYE